MEINVNSLVIEVTRRCNQSCDHCLRGDAEDLDISIQYVKNLLSNINYISSLTFTGGEPSLVVPILRSILDILGKKGISVENFYMATNGYGLDDREFAMFLLDMYKYCCSNEVTQVKISNDDFHEPKLGLLNDFLCGAFKFVQIEEKHRGNNILDEGRASEYGIGNNFRKLATKIEVEVDEDRIYIPETIYLNAKGILLPDCDYSYYSQDNGYDMIIEDFSKPVSKKKFIRTLNKRCEVKV